MHKNIKSIFLKKRIIYTSIMVFFVLLFAGGTVLYLYNNADQEGFEKLAVEAAILEEDISLQMISDQENLITMARLGAHLYESNNRLNLLVDSFQSIGLINQIMLLMPDGTVILQNATAKAADNISFEEEAKKGLYFSTRFSTPLIPDASLVCSAVPITVGNETVAILYGIIRLDEFERQYKKYLNDHEAWLFLIEQDTGNILIDTRNFSQGNLNNISTRISKPGYSHDQMLQDIRQGKDGFTAFRSEYLSEYLYARYLPLLVDNWQIILAKPESIFMAEINRLTIMLTMVTVMLVGIMAFYLTVMLKTERKLLESSIASSSIRKNLLEISQKTDSIQLAMEHITRFAKGYGAFFMDEKKDFFDFTLPSQLNPLKPEEQQFFLTELLAYMRSYRTRYPSALFPAIISLDADMKEEAAPLYQFMQSNHVKNLCLNLMEDESGNLSLLGIVNPQLPTRAKMMLEDISVCFSMAIANQNYLRETEANAKTDGLTNLKNRLAYTLELKELQKSMPADLCCVYLDVNELHMMNNYLGHAAGDAMLLYISSTLTEQFPRGNIYRIGGDEFILFTRGLDQIQLDRIMDEMQRRFDEKEYHVAMGASIAVPGINVDHLIHQAEHQMYERKSAYYQQKADVSNQSVPNAAMEYLKTGVHAVDAILPFLAEHYLGIYNVSLSADTGFSILVSPYLRSFKENEDSFRQRMVSYIQKMVLPNDQRMLLNVLNYDALTQRLRQSSTVQYAYTKLNGEQVILKIHALANCQDAEAETIWLFERQKNAQQ